MKQATEHAIARAQERYSLTLAEGDIAQILADCRSGKATCWKVTDNGNKVHICVVQRKIMVVMVDPRADFIITFLPRDYFNAGAALAHKQKAGAKQRAKASPASIPRKERRQTNRAIIDASLGDEA